MIPPLFKHQVLSTQFLAAQPRALDFSDPGTGKTRVEIEDFVSRRHRGGGCALVLAPKSLLRAAWADDFARFAPGTLTAVAAAANREKAFGLKADVYITNIDAACFLAKQPPAFFKRFDTLIIDESTAYKHASSQRSKAIGKIKKHFEYRRAQTGTPTSNGLCDLWHQAYIIDDGQRLGRSFYQFRNGVCVPEQVGPRPEHIKWVDRPGAEAAVYGLLKDIVIRHRFEDCVDIPANHVFSTSYHLTPSHMMKYSVLERDALIKLGGQTVTAVHAGALLTKLLQMASGAVYNDSGSGAYSLVDSGRTEMIMDMVEAREHCIVFFHWKHQKDQLIAEAVKRGITYCTYDGSTNDKDRKRLVDQYQNGYYRVMFAQPMSAAHGLTLTRGTSTIWTSPTFNLEHYIQGNKRIYRLGQTEKTETIMVVAPGTVEEKVWKRLQDKNVKQESLLDLLEETTELEEA